jgi:hypothetical protein
MRTPWTRRIRRGASFVLAATVVAVAAASPGAAAAGQPDRDGSRPDPSEFTLDIDNPYFPLPPGRVAIYSGSEEDKAALEIFEVTRETKQILGVPCRVVHDRVYVEGKLAEDTWDWYAQDRAGTVWYFGEATKTLDRAGHVISTEGSFEAGVDGARQGIFMPAHPVVGATYQQEYYKGHAEDRFKVTDMSASVTVPAASSENAMLTSEWTPLEPDVRGAKEYVRGVGTVHEFDTKGSSDHYELMAVFTTGEQPEDR